LDVSGVRQLQDVIGIGIAHDAGVLL
jgi:hypothetical protein